MFLKTIEELPGVSRQAVIINVGTKAASTLALISTLKFMKMPVLMIDCESDDGSLEYFDSLMKRYDFDLLSVPFKPHGTTLDWLFGKSKASNILLVDSDLEILNDYIYLMIDSFIDHPEVFGCGFIHGPEWMTKKQTGFDHHRFGLYHERPWMPLTILKTKLIRMALTKNISFNNQWVYNDFAPSPIISRLLYQRFRFHLTQNIRLSWLNYFKHEYYGHKPNYICCDTGANIYQFLKYEQGYHFVGIPAFLSRRYANHYHGLTRRKLNPVDHNATAVNNVEREIRQQLKDVYKIEII